MRREVCSEPLALFERRQDQVIHVKGLHGAWGNRGAFNTMLLSPAGERAIIKLPYGAPAAVDALSLFQLGVEEGGEQIRQAKTRA